MNNNINNKKYKYINCDSECMNNSDGQINKCNDKYSNGISNEKIHCIKNVCCEKNIIQNVPKIVPNSNISSIYTAQGEQQIVSIPISNNNNSPSIYTAQGNQQIMQTNISECNINKDCINSKCVNGKCVQYNNTDTVIKILDPSIRFYY